MIKKFSFLIGILLFSLHSGQKKEQLQTQNAELKKQIAQINSDLAKTRNESKLSVSYLTSVNKKLALREKVYTNTQKEKRFIEDEIYLRQLEINRQNRELAVLRKNYAQVLVNAYKNNGVQNKVTFILSSKNFGEAMRRVQYIKQYSDYQDKKAAETKAMTNYGVSAPSAGSNFSSNKGKLGMPVSGSITHKFGRQPHPVFKNIVEENNGIKISAAKGSSARAVFPGVVSSISPSSDGTKTVLIKHGDYFTIYSNLSTNSVSKGQQVSAGTPVGSIAQDFDGSYTLDFQIWNGTTPVDPLGWVSY